MNAYFDYNNNNHNTRNNNTLERRNYLTLRIYSTALQELPICLDLQVIKKMCFQFNVHVRAFVCAVGLYCIC